MFDLIGRVNASILDAFSKSQAIIEFDMTGTILHANENFCRALGYDISEIKGKHHRMFVDPSESSEQAYRNFWEKLGRGEFDAGQYKRIAKGGKEIWIEASYNPVFVGKRLVKVVKIATDITAQKIKAMEDAGKLSALSRAQAVIEFTPRGEILTANENFLKTLGYQAQEIAGRHHSMFCEPGYARSDDYATFWQRLAAGEYIANEFLRIGKGGKQVWIQATYNPILDFNGKVFKVVKFASDVTPRVQNVEALANALRHLAEGDLMQQLNAPFLPALETLRTDFNNTANKLCAAIQAVAENAGAISAASTEISSASNDLAQRTERQAASIEQTAAALEEITTTGSDSSQRAQEAGMLVRKTKENAERSGLIVREAIVAMSKIEASASEIGSIIGVIDEIAFQTNLLALNAGVEAARAGEAGKGFAVVAQEVRELAQRSAKAAKEIKDLISTSNSHVKNGVSLVGDTGKALQDIVEHVVRVDGNVGSIVESSKEQATGLREINTAVNTMDQGTQQNAAMVEQTSAAAHSLARDAETLFRIVSQFKVGASRSEQNKGTGLAKSNQPTQNEVAQKPIAQQKQIATQGNAALKIESWEEF